MQILSLVWGILAILGMIVGLIPFLGATNWLLLPFAGIGVILCGIAYSTAGINPKGRSIAGLVCCTCAVIFGTLRLFLGGGVV